MFRVENVLDLGLFTFYLIIEDYFNHLLKGLQKSTVHMISSYYH